MIFLALFSKDLFLIPFGFVKLFGYKISLRKTFTAHFEMYIEQATVKVNSKHTDFKALIGQATKRAGGDKQKEGKLWRATPPAQNTVPGWLKLAEDGDCQMLSSDALKCVRIQSTMKEAHCVKCFDPSSGRSSSLS